MKLGKSTRYYPRADCKKEICDNDGNIKFSGHIDRGGGGPPIHSLRFHVLVVLQRYQNVKRTN